MAGGTKCYLVMVVDGTLHHEVTEHSPKFADSPKEAVAKLERGQPAYVRFHELEIVQRGFEHSRGGASFCGGLCL